MVKRLLAAVLVAFAAFLFSGCAGEKMELEVKATMDGQPAAGASVSVDGVDEGLTGSDGAFVKVLKKKPGAEVAVVVSRELPGYRITPWKKTFLMRLPKDGAVDRYSFDAELEATRYVTIVASEEGLPIADAVVKADGKEAGTTDAKGEFVYEYRQLPKKGVRLMVTKQGYAAWTKKGPLEPGERIVAALTKRVSVTVRALTEDFGHTDGIRGIKMYIGRKYVGRTNDRGVTTWSYDGEPGRKVRLTLSAPGYIPAKWRSTITLQGNVDVDRYFYPATARPIRTAIFRIVSNTPNADLQYVLSQTEKDLADRLFRYSCFKEVPAAALKADMKRHRLKIDRILARGWRKTPLKRTVDMIVVGSVAKDEDGYLIETTFTSSDGKVIHSQIARASSERRISRAAKEIAYAVLEKFPFEGAVIGTDEDRYVINLGEDGYEIERNMEFSLQSPRKNAAGRVTGYRHIGRMRVKKTHDKNSLAVVDELAKGAKVRIGDRVVRNMVREEDREKSTAVVFTKGGLPPDVSPLGGVNVYLNDEWVSTTGDDGKANVPVRLGRKYDLLLYRHGYQQVNDRMRINKDGAVKEYSLTVNNAVFKVDSRPSSAEVFVDDEQIGRTPILDGKPVTLGFHTVRVSLGGDYRDWEEVVEFAKKVEDRTGGRSIVLHKDFLKIGERAEQKGDIDGAITAYESTGRNHPDYSEAHNRLAQLYLDEKGDYDGAIREFENVLSLPENRQLVYKQYAVTFTNLGHAYYEKGNALVPRDREGAAQAFAAAIKNLQKARQNSRFFPTQQYDAAVHDTYYYLALSYHKLYLLTRKPSLLNDADLAWRDYFDFFPKSLEGNSSFEQSRAAAQKYWDQIRKKM